MKSIGKSFFAAWLAIVLLLGLSLPAGAANTSLPPETGSLTIHKYLLDVGTDPNTPNQGEAIDETTLPEGAEPLAGAVFGVWKLTVGYDEETGNLIDPVPFPETTKEAEEMIRNGELELEPIGYYTTGPDGTVTIQDLDRAYYYVKELSSTVDLSSAVKPFIVAVPMTDPQGDGWIQDVHVYPKNHTLLDGVDKDVNDQVYDTGHYYDEQDNKHVWTINVPVPSNVSTAANNRDETVDPPTGSYLRIIDTLPSSFNYEVNSLAVYAGMSKNDRGEKLEQSQHYNLYVGQNSKNETVITVDFTKAGLQKLADGPNSNGDLIYGNVFVYFNSVLADDADQNVMIKNDLQVWYSADPGSDPGDPSDPNNPWPDPDPTPEIPPVDPGDPDDPNNPDPDDPNYPYPTPDPNDPDPDDPRPPIDPSKPVPEEVPYVIVGKLVVQKVGADGKNNLAGAQFKIATSEANAKNGVFLQKDGEDVVAVSGTDGSVTFTNLNLTPQFDQTGTFTGFKEEAYWLVEVSAPTGYNLLQSPIKVAVLDNIAENETDENGTPIPNHVVFKDGVDRINSAELKIVNTKKFTLPVTGGAGTAALTLGGVVLLGTGAVLLGAVIVHKKKKASK